MFSRRFLKTSGHGVLHLAARLGPAAILLVSGCGEPTTASGPRAPARMQELTRFQHVSVTHLPLGARIVRKDGEQTELLARATGPSAELSLPYRVFVASDGVRDVEEVAGRSVVVEIQAFGFLTKRTDLTVPGTQALDGSLTPVPVTGPACAPGESADTPEDAERAYELVLMNKDVEALALFKTAYERTRQPELLVDIGQCELRGGDPASAAKSFRDYVAACPRSLAVEQVRVLADRAEHR